MYWSLLLRRKILRLVQVGNINFAEKYLKIAQMMISPITLSQVTHFGLYTTISNSMKMAELVQPMDRKTLWEKEKLLDMSNFFSSDSVFKRPVLETCKNMGLIRKGLIRNKKVGKRRKCCFTAFSPLSTMFSKAFYFRVMKTRDNMVIGWQTRS